MAAGIMLLLCLPQADAGSNVIAIIKPDSGPDYSGDDSTVKCLPHLKKAGVTLSGMSRHAHPQCTTHHAPSHHYLAWTC